MSDPAPSNESGGGPASASGVPADPDADGDLATTRRWPVAGVVFGVLWVFVRGPDPTVDAVLGQFLLGLAVGLPVAYVFRRLYAEGIDLRRSARSVPYAVLYVLTFLREVIVANVDVAYRVLAPGQPIEPEVILIPLRVRTDLGVTTIANSITITPGTLTLDYDRSENALYVHVIDGRDPAAIVEPIRAWEDYALAIFDEELSPGDPAPDFAVFPPDRTHPVLEQAAVETEGVGADGETRSERDAGEENGSDAGRENGTDADEGRERGGDGDGR